MGNIARQFPLEGIMSAHATTCICQQPVPAEPVFVPTVEAMADAMRTHYGNCTEDVLQGLGFPISFQKSHRDEAVALANRRFVAKAERPRRPSLAEREAQAASIILDNMPPVIFLVAELQGRGFSTAEIDQVLPKARARAALSFARGGLH
jgi:hypothetical protein